MDEVDDVEVPVDDAGVLEAAGRALREPAAFAAAGAFAAAFGAMPAALACSAARRTPWPALGPSAATALLLGAPPGGGLGLGLIGAVGC